VKPHVDSALDESKKLDVVANHSSLNLSSVWFPKIAAVVNVYVLFTSA